MQAHWLWKASTLTLAGALALVLGTNDNLANAGQGGVTPQGPQPHMQAALTALETAQGQLEKATTDKGGHRAKALQLTKDAIVQVKKGIEFDNEHKGDKKDVTTIE